MGFFSDFIGSVAKDMDEKRQRILRIKGRYENCDDNELKRLFQQKSGDDKIAIGLLLKERGYGN